MGANQKHRCQSLNDVSECYALMGKKGKQPLWWVGCDYQSQLRGAGSERKLPEHDCFKVQGEPILAWCAAHKDECVCVGGVFQFRFEMWHESPEFKVAIKETLSAVVQRLPKKVTSRVISGPPWLTVLFCVARSLEIAGFDGFDATMKALWDHIHKMWAGPGCPNSDLYAGCVELLRPRLHKEDAKLKEILDARDNQLKAEIKRLGERQDEVVNAHKRALELQGDKSKAARKELARLIDDTAKEQAELERETKAFKETFAAQLYQAEKQLASFETEINELRDAVIALEKRFDEQEKQMAKLQTKLDSHSAQLDAHGVDITELHKELAATNATVKNLEAAVDTAKELFEDGSTQRKALEDRLRETQRVVEQQGVALREREEEMKLLNKKAVVISASLHHAHKKVNENAHRNDEAKIAGGDSDAAGATASSSVGTGTVSHAEETADAAPTSPTPRDTASSSGTPWSDYFKDAKAKVMALPQNDDTNNLQRAADAPCAVEATPEASPQVANNAPEADGAQQAEDDEAENDVNSSSPDSPVTVPLAAQPDQLLAAALSQADDAMIAPERETAAAMAASEAEARTSPAPRDMASSSDGTGMPSLTEAADDAALPTVKRVPLRNLGDGNLPAAATCLCALDATSDASSAVSPAASPAAAAEPDDDEQAANNAPAADGTPALDVAEPDEPGAPSLDVAEPDAPAAGAMVTMTTITTTLVLAFCVLLLAVAIKDLPLEFFFFLEGM